MINNETTSVTSQEAPSAISSKTWQLTLNKSNVMCSGTCIVHEVSWSGSSGAILRLVGANGSGKTSLLRNILLRSSKDSQTESLSLSDQASASPRGLSASTITLTHHGQIVSIPASCNWIGHTNGIKHGSTALKEAMYWHNLLHPRVSDGKGFSSAQREKVIFAALDAWSLWGKRSLPLQWLSAGQRKRLALSRLNIIQRPLWLLDEPESSLDEEGIDLLTKALLSHSARGGITVYATHQDKLPLTDSIELHDASVTDNGENHW